MLPGHRGNCMKERYMAGRRIFVHAGGAIKPESTGYLISVFMGDPERIKWIIK